MEKYIEKSLLKQLINVAADIANGNYSKDIIKLTDKKYPKKILELAEAFGLMSVQLESREMRLENLLYDVVESLVEAIDAKSYWTAGHSKRVTRYALLIADDMGLDKAFVKKLKMAALLHDIGKLGISEKILDKEAILDEDEKTVMKKHPVIGTKIVGHIKEFREVLDGIRYHHENYDGKGYPNGLRGAEIPLIARILAVADSFDCITSDRPYKKKISKYHAYRVLISQKNKQWDGGVVDAFLRSQKRKK